MNDKVKKYVLPNLPYLFIFWLADKLGQAFRLSAGENMGKRFMDTVNGLALLGSDPLPSLHPRDLLAGIAGAAVIWIVVYFKKKNAKKWRKNIEYGSARWGGPDDIKPFVDPKPENNVILTQTEFLTMNSRPKNPATARNKNCLIVGGSGSGKTRFWLKPNLLQLHSSYVVVDPKGGVKERTMEDLLKEETYSFVSPRDKKFIIAFDAEMDRLGYTSNQTIGDGYCWGRKMIIYTKAGVKSKKSYARIYLRENDLILRMYFSSVDKQRQAIEQAPDYIQQAFTGDYGACKHCHNMKEDSSCSHRKSYTIHGKQYEFCDGFAFWFFSPDLARIPEYIKLFLAFYPEKRKK